MDIDALAKDFARFKPMLDDMLVGYKEYQAEKAARLAGPSPDVDAALHAAIHAPLNDPPEAVAARQQQAQDNADQAAAAQAEMDEANANLQAEADAKAEADRLQVEADAKAEEDRLRAEADAHQAENDRVAAEAPQNDAATGQNQGQGEPDGSAGGDAPENAGEAPPGASLAEQPPQTGLDRIDEVAEQPTVSTDQGTTAKPV